MRDLMSEQLEVLKENASSTLKLAEELFKQERPEDHARLCASVVAGTVQLGVTVHLLPGPMVEVWAQEYGGARQVLVTVRPDAQGGVRVLN